MHLMLAEIREQPDRVEEVLAGAREAVSGLVRVVHDNDIRFVVIAARGTSDHAATYLKYLLEIVAGIPTALAAPSVYTLYDAHLRLGNVLVIGISQSGQGADIVQVLSSARSAGALTACITNNPNSPITGVSDHVLLCNAREERAVAATKTYTTTLAVGALLVFTLADRRDLMDALLQVPDWMRSALGTDDQIASSVDRYRYMSECAVLARGVNQATALEVALKLMETSYVVAKPYSGADFMHGPVAMVHEGFPCFVFAPAGRAYPFMLETALKLRERGAELCAISNEPEMCSLGHFSFALPAGVHELVSPLVAVVPGQLLAYHLAVTRGGNPDRPRGLAKVTVTR